MDISQVIKSLKEDGNKVFTTKNNEFVYKVFKNSYGEIFWEDCYGKKAILNLTSYFLNAEYEEYKQPVMWQEAIQAWVEMDKNLDEVYCEFKEKKITLREMFCDGRFNTYRDLLKYGNWYIQ